MGVVTDGAEIVTTAQQARRLGFRARGATIGARGPRSRLPRDRRLRAHGRAGHLRDARSPRRRPAARRLRRGNPAAAPSLGHRARRPRGRLPDASARRPRPRAAGNAEDLRAARPGHRDAGARPARHAGATRRPGRRGRKDRLSARRRRARARGVGRARRLPDRGIRRRPRCPCTRVRASRGPSVPAASTSTPPMRSASRTGPHEALCSAESP